MDTNKFNENQFIEEVKNYIEGTYSSHYASDDGVQLIDYIYSIGDGSAYCRTNALKYIARYGKKDGNNKKDLYKAIHCIIILYEFCERDRKKNDNGKVQGYKLLDHREGYFSQLAKKTASFFLGLFRNG